MKSILSKKIREVIKEIMDSRLFEHLLTWATKLVKTHIAGNLIRKR